MISKQNLESQKDKTEKIVTNEMESEVKSIHEGNAAYFEEKDAEKENLEKLDKKRDELKADLPQKTKGWVDTNKLINNRIERDTIERLTRKENIRTARNLKGKLTLEEDLFSLSRTMHETEMINSLIRDIEKEPMELEDKAYTLAKLENVKGRNLSHMMLNDTKSTGDSSEMKMVKRAVEALEKQVTMDHGKPMTIADMSSLQETYQTAIMMCEKYLSSKGSFIKAWSYRKDMVRNTMNRLLQEQKLIVLGKTLFGIENPEEPISSGLELMTVARTYQLRGSMRTVPQKYRIEKKIVGGIDFAGIQFGGEEVEEKVYDGGIRNLPTVERASTHVLLNKFRNTHEYLMADLLQSDDKKLSRLLPPKKKFKDYTKDEKLSVYEFRQIRRILKDFSANAVDSAIIKIGDTYGNIVQRDDNSLYLEANGITIPLGTDTGMILRDMENDVIANLDKYENIDLADVLENMEIDFKTMSAGDLLRIRNACAVVLQKKTGMKRTDFDNLPVEEMKKLALYAANGTDIKSALQERINKHSQREKKIINNMQTIELSRLTKEKDEKVEYLPPNIAVNDQGQKIKRNEDLENGWTIQEARTKKLVEEIIFDPQSTEADISKVGNKIEFEKFKEELTQEREEKKKENKNKDKDEQAEELIEEPIDAEMYSDYKKGLRMQELLFRNLGGIISLLADMNRDRKQKPVSFVTQMLDKLPIFVLGEGLGDELKEAVEGAMDEVVKMLDHEMGFDKMDDKKRLQEIEIMSKFLAVSDNLGDDFQGRALDIGGKMVRDKIEVLSISQIVALGKAQRKIDKAIDDAADELQKVMGECSEFVFGNKKQENQRQDQNHEDNDGLEDLLKEYEIVGNLEFTNEEKEIIRKEETPLRIRNLKKSIKMRKDNRDVVKNNIKSAKMELEQKRRQGVSDDELNLYKQTYNDALEAKNATLDIEKKVLEKAMEDAAKGNKGQGLYIKNVMKSYFKAMPTMDKRSMFANAIKSAKPINMPNGERIGNLNDDEKMEYFSDILGGLFKGAGPLFQKLLQGLPTASVPKGLAKALDEMKDSLLPIPEQVVEQQMSGIVTRSNGKIESIKVDESLGAASVGQAFLCTIKGPEFPDGKKVVVKLLRPDVRNRMKREYDIMKQAAKDTDKGMEATFENTFKRIEEELDLTIESRHVVEGQIYNNASKDYVANHVKSMKLSNIVDPTQDCMIAELAEGTTVKKYLQSDRDFLEQTMEKYYEKEEPDEAGKQKIKKAADGTPVLKPVGGRTAYDAMKDRAEILTRLRELMKRQDYLCELADKWVNEGIFGSGFYHGDLHSGNIMINSDGATVIDFGNCTQLTNTQQVQVTKMMMAAATGEVETFMAGFKALLESTSEADFKKNETELFYAFKDVLTTGDDTSTAQRIAVALLRAQEIGFELPSAVANFSACQIRLQNAIDDANKLIKDMKESLDKLNELPRTEDPVVRQELFSRIYTKVGLYEGKDGDMLEDLKQERLNDGGMTRDAFFAGLQQKDKGRRMLFMIQNMGTPSMLADMITMAQKKVKVKGEEIPEYPVLSDFIATKMHDDDYELEYAILRDNGMNISKEKGEFKKIEDQLCYLYSYGQTMYDNKTGEKYKSILDNLKGISYVPGPTENDPVTDLSELYNDTEFDGYLKNYLDLIDNPGAGSEDMKKGMENVLWEKYLSKEENAEQFFRREQERIRADGGEVPNARKDKDANRLVIVNYFKLQNISREDAPEDLEKIIAENKKDFERAIKTVESRFSDSEYGEELRKACDDYEKLMNRQISYCKNEEQVKVEDKEFNELAEKIGDLSQKAANHMLDELIEAQQRAGYDNKELYDTDDFMEVMTRVIHRKKFTAMRRFGAGNTFKYRNGITSSF